MNLQEMRESYDNELLHVRVVSIYKAISGADGRVDIVVEFLEGPLNKRLATMYDVIID